MITYLGMTSPMAILATVSWIRNPYKKTKEVKVKKMSTTESAVMLTFSAAVTVLFYFILKALGNESLTVSTFSVTTSFIASYLTFMRSPYYALAYAANDVVLIVLWIIASLTDTSYVTMAVCFFMFLLNDLYGFINWRRMMKRQNDS
jgi:nicotinamide mononucleotide transporter PnuC